MTGRRRRLKTGPPDRKQLLNDLFQLQIRFTNMEATVKIVLTHTDDYRFYLKHAIGDSVMKRAG